MSEIEVRNLLLDDFQTPGREGGAGQPWYRHPGWKLASRVLTVALLVGAVVWFFTLRPVVFGGPATYVMVSGISMEPTYHDGDMVVLHKKDAYQPGDVIAYHVPKGEFGEGSIVIHRVVGVDERGYITQGDNRTGRDTWRPTDADVLGRTWLHVPGLGRQLGTLRSPLILAAAAAAFTIYFVLTFERPKRRAKE